MNIYAQDTPVIAVVWNEVKKDIIEVKGLVWCCNVEIGYDDIEFVYSVVDCNGFLHKTQNVKPTTKNPKIEPVNKVAFLMEYGYTHEDKFLVVDTHGNEQTIKSVDVNQLADGLNWSTVKEITAI